MAQFLAVLSFVRFAGSAILNGLIADMVLVGQSKNEKFGGLAGSRFIQNQISPILKPKMENFYIEQFGRDTMDQSPRGITSITKTGTPRTTFYLIFRSYLLRAILCCTPKQTNGLEVKPTKSSLPGRPENSVCVVAVSKHLNSTPVYDLTIEHHHCYVANGVLVSNSDALRTFAEAERLGMIEGTSATARESRRRGPMGSKVRVLRGPGEGAYPGNPSGFGPKVIRF